MSVPPVQAGALPISRDALVKPRVPELLRLEARLLYSFAFAKGAVPNASELLVQTPILARESGQPSHWMLRGPTALYTQELHAHVADFLFPGGDEGVAHLELDPQVTARWLRDVRVPLGWGETEPVQLKPGRSGIELFLSNLGVGVLSIGVAVSSRLTPERAMGVLYRLSQLRPKRAVALHIPHPSEDPDARVDLSKVAPAPAEDAPLAERVGVRGGTFHIGEVIDCLLAPIASPQFELRQLQAELSAYSILVFDSSCDYSQQATREQFSQLLSGLAQLEEPTHAGVSLETLAVENAVLNSNHWTAVSMLASTHLLADQLPPQGRTEHPFNSERVPRVLFKYFVVYLLALLQRLVLQRVLEDAGALAGDEARARAELRPLRTTLLEFAIRGYFTHVSRRDPVQRCYRMAQAAMDVPETLESSRKAIADLESRMLVEAEAKLVAMQAEALATQVRLLETNGKLTAESATSQRTLVHMQHNLELLEVFIFGFYSTELVNILFFHGTDHHELHVPVLLAVFVSFSAVAWYVLMRKKHS